MGNSNERKKIRIKKEEAIEAYLIGGVAKIEALEIIKQKLINKTSETSLFEIFETINKIQQIDEIIKTTINELNDIVNALNENDGENIIFE